MKALFDRLDLSMKHLKCLDEIFRNNHSEYKRIERIFQTMPFKNDLIDISRTLYAGGKTKGNSKIKLNRQMILGDIIEYIYSGRAYYYAVDSEHNLCNFLKLILYSVNQLLIHDTITVRADLRKLYLHKLEKVIPNKYLYEKEGDRELSNKLKRSNTVYEDDVWDEFNTFVDSILPKTLGTPKELVVFAELIRLKIGILIPLLLTQRVFGENDPIAPPDFLLLKANKEIFGLELGYGKEGQSREFSIRTGIPTIAVDLDDNLHNRCPKCGEFILYCDPVIESYSNGTLESKLNKEKNKYLCNKCPLFDNGNCKFSNYYGKCDGHSFNGELLKGERHYHAACVINEQYTFRRNPKSISDHKEEFFSQIPIIQGIKGLQNKDH